jgi:antagonist of KipI
MSQIRVIRAGLCSTVQDLGRSGFRHLGVPIGGAMDRVSHELANRLVGNLANAATIEMTLTGDEIEFADDTLIAITGAEMTPVRSSKIAGTHPVAQQCPVIIPAGSRLCIQSARRGCRCYLAVAGGVDVPVIMDSRATVLRANFGGYEGRMLAAGDELTIGVPSESSRRILARLSALSETFLPRWFARTTDLPNPDVATMRIVAATHTQWLTQSELARLSDSVFRVSTQSDRMGYRLDGLQLKLAQRQEILSEGTVPGTIQLPPSGHPILLMADCAPTGGYPRIGHVISADLGHAAQLRPGQSVKFAIVTVEQAQNDFLQQRECLSKALTMVELITQHKSH